MKAILGDSGVPESLAWPESLDRAGRRAAYTFADDLFLLDLAASRFERLTRTAEKEGVPRLSPDGRRLAFVRGNDLFVLDLASRAEIRLTSDGSATVLNGALSWVYWEEVFDHEDAGFWWSADGSAIAFLRTDESAVSPVSFGDFKPAVPRVITQRYPKAGGVNPSVRLGIADVGSGATAWMDPEVAPYEYVVAVEWSPDNRRVAVQTVNRLQTRLDLYFVDRASGKPTRVLSETDGGWVNTHDLEFLEDGKGFLWSSERDGYTHLYRYAADGTLVNPVTKGAVVGAGPRWLHHGPSRGDRGGGRGARPRLLHRPREVAGRAAPLPGAPRRIGPGEAVARGRRPPGDLQPGSPLLPRRPLEPRDAALAVAPRRRRGAPGDARAAAGRAPGRPRRARPGAADACPRRTASPLQASILKPKDFDPARRYPVILAVYGGPGAPTVLDRWGGDVYFNQLLLKEGYVVASIDNRSATAASRAHETSVARRLWSDGELGDLVAGVRWLKAQPWVDPERIGVWGWSGGGMFTLVALTRSKEFKAGIAVAPGTDWRFYDTKFTEAYMKPPAENPDGYEHTSLVSRAKDLHGRLLLVFGTHDDNVHPQNSWAFVDEAVKAGIPFDLMAYPMRKHGIEDRPARIHLFHKMLEFWKQRL